ncbi:nucleoside phosphatase GDA1/CD39, partial [Rhodotorula sp. JG-1b]
CTPPPGQKATSYAIMIDAGSTGSRLHLYTFSHCDPDPKALPKLEDELFVTTKPGQGLSSFKGDPTAAAESLRDMMQRAVDAVPESERGCTPLAVKATAGLRLLGPKQSQEILDEVERWLKIEWPFPVVEDGVVIMDGRDEGVYAWITINYLLGVIGPDQPASAGTAAVMDLGGASTQIVFEPIFDPVSKDKLAPGDHVYDLDFAGDNHVLYQHSHLGYGLMQARRAVHNLVAYSHVWLSAPKGKLVDWDNLTTKDKIHNPCMFKGEKKVVTLDPPGRNEVQVTMEGTGAGFEACRRVVEVMIAKDAACDKPPCAFAGVYQPKMGEVFAAGKVWALSFFYDRIAPLGLTSPFSISDLRQLTSDVCAGRKSPAWSRFKGNKEAMAELSDRPEYCLDLTFMYSLLSLGYELDEERQIWMGKKVSDVELGWALGAALAMIEGHLTCRA